MPLDLAHVGDVKEASALASLVVLGEDAAVVLVVKNGEGVAGELD